MNKRKGKSPKFIFDFKKNELVAAAKSAGLSTKNRWRATRSFGVCNALEKTILMEKQKVSRALSRLTFFI